MRQKCLSFPLASEDTHQALVFVTVYNPLSWGHRLLTRASQHVLLSSQTLGDLFDAIPCTSNEMPQETLDEQGNVRWTQASTSASSGAVFCIEDMLYGDGQSEKDYSEYVFLCSTLLDQLLTRSSKLIEHLHTLSAKSRPDLVKSSPMHDIALSSIALRFHKPYWALHAGDCEHFLVFEHVRYARNPIAICFHWI